MRLKYGTELPRFATSALLTAWVVLKESKMMLLMKLMAMLTLLMVLIVMVCILLPVCNQRGRKRKGVQYVKNQLHCSTICKDCKVQFVQEPCIRSVAALVALVVCSMITVMKVTSDDGNSWRMLKGLSANVTSAVSVQGKFENLKVHTMQCRINEPYLDMSNT